MLGELQEHLDKTLNTYSEGEYYDHVVKARQKYFELTGLTNEEDDDYEVRMRSFNNWFIMHYPVNGELTPLQLYLNGNELNKDVKEALENFRYSVFEFSGKNLSGKLVVRDLLNNEKLIFTGKSSPIPVFKNDIFIGRLLRSEEDFLLMDGMCLLPGEAKSIIKKQVKKVRKLEQPENEDSFLLELENLKNKWQRFGHVDASKIFVFNS
jgi:hypothetical protein